MGQFEEVQDEEPGAGVAAGDEQEPQAEPAACSRHCVVVSAVGHQLKGHPLPPSPFPTPTQLSY